MVRDTSIEAYKQIKDEGLLSQRKMEVYEILFHHGPLTAHEIVDVARKKYPLANQTGFNARLSELKEMGVAIEVGEKVNPISNKTNLLWDITSKLPEKIKKTKKRKCRACNGTGFVDDHCNHSNVIFTSAGVGFCEDCDEQIDTK